MFCNFLAGNMSQFNNKFLTPAQLLHWADSSTEPIKFFMTSTKNLGPAVGRTRCRVSCCQKDSRYKEPLPLQISIEHTKTIRYILVYKSTLGRDLHLRVARDDIRRGRVAVAVSSSVQAMPRCCCGHPQWQLVGGWTVVVRS